MDEAAREREKENWSEVLASQVQKKRYRIVFGACYVMGEMFNNYALFNVVLGKHVL